MSLKPRANTPENQQEQTNERFDQMQEFNQQTQDLVRAIHFAVKREKPSE